MKNAEEVVREYRTISDQRTWVKTARFICLTAVICAPIGIAYLGYHASELEWTTIELSLAIAGLSLAGLLCLTILMITPTILHLLNRKELELQLEIDIAQAVSQTMMEVFQDIIPGYGKVSGQIHIGTELLRTVQMESDRLHILKASIRNQMPQWNEAAALGRLIIEIAAQSSVTTSVGDLQRVLDEMAGSNIRPIPPRS